MAQFDSLPEKTNEIARNVVDAVFKVHKVLGPGLLESIYEKCLCHELKKRGIPFKSQVSLPIIYDGERLDAGLRLDLIIADLVIIELKAVEKMNPLYKAQLLTYLKLTGLRLGLLINFNVPLIRDGIKRVIL